MRVMVSSIRFATFTRLESSTIHGNTSSPLGIADMTDSISLKNMVLDTMSRHMLPYMRHQPVKMGAVLLLPPMAKASGAAMVSVDSTTYCSAIFSSSFSTFHMMIISNTITTSHPAVRLPKMPASTRCTSIAVGSCKRSITLDVIFSPISQSWELPSSRNANTKLRANSILGSSPSKPRPEAMLRRAWKTRFPSSSAQPTARSACMISGITGAWALMYVKSRLIISSSAEENQFQHSRIRLYIHSIKP